LLDNGAKASFYILDVNSDWTITSDNDWLGASLTGGNPGQYIKIEVLAGENNSAEGARTGKLAIKAGNLTKEVTVSQSKDGLEISVPNFSLSKYGVKDDASSLSFVVTSSSDWTATAPSWITLTPASGAAGEVTVTFTVSKNETGALRTGAIVIASVRGDNKAEATVSQSATIYEDNDLLFKDDFSWLRPVIDAYNAINPTKPVGDSIAEGNASASAPNIYAKYNDSYELRDKFIELFNGRGYVDLRYVEGSYECMYLQDAYLKMGKTDYHTGLKIPALDLEEGETADIVLSFDWCAHMTGSGNIDKVTITVEVEGEGTVEGTSDPAGKTCDPIASDQVKKELKWMTPSVTIVGVTKDTRINIRPTQMMLAADELPDQQRWHCDNIMVARKK
ncbi:MAG: BACON domain-containing protein, partial [Candidatus Cryptobacteroides sp.]